LSRDDPVEILKPAFQRAKGNRISIKKPEHGALKKYGRIHSATPPGQEMFRLGRDAARQTQINRVFNGMDIPRR
jgi:hypothetical protein